MRRRAALAWGVLRDVLAEWAGRYGPTLEATEPHELEDLEIELTIDNEGRLLDYAIQFF